MTEIGAASQTPSGIELHPTMRWWCLLPDPTMKWWCRLQRTNTTQRRKDDAKKIIRENLCAELRALRVFAVSKLTKEWGHPIHLQPRHSL